MTSFKGDIISPESLSLKKNAQCCLHSKTGKMDAKKLNEKQLNALNQFKQVMADATLRDSRDEFFLQWLVARKFDVNEAEKMLRHSLEWRRVNGIDDVIETWNTPPVFEKYFPIGYTGQDKFGCPLLINTFGRADLKGLFESASKRVYLRHTIYLNERFNRLMAELSQKEGRAIMQETVIFDMEHVSWKQVAQKHVMEIGIEIAKFTEAHYPEYLRKVFIINAPKIFPLIFGIVKPFMQPDTISKISVYDHNSSVWKAALLEEIDADQLPVHYGGTMTDPDGNPMCLTKICYGGEIPKSYYITGQKPQVTDSMKHVTIAKGSKKQLEMDVKVANSKLKWEFISEGGDIGFQVYYLIGQEKIDVFPWDRIDSDRIVEQYQIVCTRATTYYVEFDNSYSYLRSKQIWYSISVEGPDT